VDNVSDEGTVSISSVVSSEIGGHLRDHPVLHPGRPQSESFWHLTFKFICDMYLLIDNFFELHFTEKSKVILGTCK
jgi:hypothetical protein